MRESDWSSDVCSSDLAAGFEEVGDKGLKLRDEIREITHNFSKIRIVGPNCTGLTQISDDNSGFFSAFIVQYGYKYGNIAVISQSGMLNGGYFIYLNTTYPEIGFRYLASIGNKMDLSENEFLEYYIMDSTVKVIVLYLESFKEPRKFIKLCNLAKKKYDKTVIVLKGGTTTQGSNATLSHTGSIAENSNLVQGILKQSHVIQANNFYDLFKYARTFSTVYNANLLLPKQGNVSIVTVSGGAGTVLADLSQIYGLFIPEYRQTHILL
jgi:acetyltransferase